MLKTLTVSLFGFMPLALAAHPVLLLGEEQEGIWRDRWMIEGCTASLQCYDQRGAAPDVDFARHVHVTPTFVLVEDGSKLGRIEGYPDNDFFWGLLGMMSTEAAVTLDQKEGAHDG